MTWFLTIKPRAPLGYRAMRLCAGILLAASALQAQPAVSHRTNIAVLPFESDSTTDPQLLSSLAECLQTQLVSTDSFTVLDRSKIDEILTEQGFQQSGACDNNCQVQMGKLLGVEKLASGSVRVLQAQWLITANLTDVSSGSLERAATVQVAGGPLDVIAVGCPAVAQRLANPGDTSTHSAVRGTPLVVTPGWQPQNPPEPLLSRGQKKWLFVGSMVALGLGGVTYGYLHELEIDRSVSAYRSLPLSATPEQFELARSKAKSAEKEHATGRNVGYGVGAALLATGLYFAIWI